MNVKSRFARCERFLVSPVSRLSIPITSKPRSSSASDRCEPMKPAAPVMTIRFLAAVIEEPAVGADQSVGVLVEEAANEGEPHDLEVEPDRPVLDVVQVVLDPLLERCIAAPAVHLRPA